MLFFIVLLDREITHLTDRGNRTLTVKISSLSRANDMGKFTKPNRLNCPVGAKPTELFQNRQGNEKPTGNQTFS
jgi:hypothetical protein